MVLCAVTEKKQKKKKKQKQKTVLKQKKQESQKFLELLEILEELEKEEHVDIQICPNCKSPRVRRVRSMEGDMSGHMGMLPEKYECKDCGWRERLVIKATNKKLSIKEVAIIAEAADLGN
jgi:hypothetical protein